MKRKVLILIVYIIAISILFCSCTPKSITENNNNDDDNITQDDIPDSGNPNNALTPYTIPDTGEVDFYSNTGVIGEPSVGDAFYGQDATYQSNAPSYTDNGDSTVTDNVTGLVWQQNVGEKMTYAEAVTSVKNFTLGGHDDWRIPTIKELYSLIQYTGTSGGEQAGDKQFIDTTFFVQPIGNTSIGEREIDAQTWSCTEYVGKTMNNNETIFGVNFIDGRIKGYPKYKGGTETENIMYFRFVRGNTDYGKNNFKDNGDGTITDYATGLMWQTSDSGEGMDWENSLSYAEQLEFASYGDWRLPNAKELQSIVDYSRSLQTTNSAAIDPLFGATKIIDMDGEYNYPYYWSSTSHLNGINPYSSAVYVAFGEAQGIMNDTLMDVHGAVAQRSDPKTGNPDDYPKSLGPQGDIQRVFNYVRCVRSVDISEKDIPNTSTSSSSKCFNFAIQADAHMDEETNLDVLNDTFNNVIATNPEFIMDLGDTLMLGELEKLQQTASERIGFVDGLYSAFNDIPICIINGNHDGQNGFEPTTEKVSREMRIEYFPMPFVDSDKFSGNVTTANYYSFEKNNTLFVVLDPYTYLTDASGFWNDTLGLEQFEWLENTLANSDADFKFVFTHNIIGGINDERRGGIAAAELFEWGGKNLDGVDEFSQMRPNWSMPIHDLLVKYGVHAVFHGHDHLYANEELNGIKYILVPQPGTIRQETGLAEEKGYTTGVILPSAGFLNVHITEDSVTIEYYKTKEGNGYAVADTIVISK